MIDAALEPFPNDQHNDKPRRRPPTDAKAPNLRKLPSE
jgi:hypothetical protein